VTKPLERLQTLSADPDWLSSVRSLPGIRHPGGDLRSEGESTVYWNIAKMAVRRPRLIPYLLSAAWAFRARDWYRRPPFLPLPPRSYLEWRLDTAYGDPDVTPPIDEFERYLVWSAAMRSQMRRGRS